MVELEEDKLEHGLVELQEGDHYPVIHVGREDLGPLVRDQPRHRLAADLGLVVESLDRDEDLFEAARSHYVGLPLQAELPGVVDAVHRNLVALAGRQGGEQVDDTKGVVDVPHGVHEGGVPLPHQLVEGVLGPPQPQLLRELELLLGLGLVYLALIGLDVPEHLEQGLVEQERQVLDMVVRLVRPLWLLSRLPGVDPLQDTKAAELREAELQLPQRLRPRQVLGRAPLLPLLLFHRLIEHHVDVVAPTD
mmetsp:Transcript_2800/g.10397  ORF Transcript_2800/g.10397 Transcript_2800/m.10397 type:complete len:249 (-) Transcript_2800:154-900(-)